MNTPDQLFRTANHVEACLWVVIGLAILIHAARTSRPRRTRAFFAAICFLLFGASDIVEAETGAWWRPWWLLLWKGACLIGILWWVRSYLRERRKR